MALRYSVIGIDATLSSQITTIITTNMPIFHHQVNNRQYTTFAPLITELIYDPTKNYLFDLSYLKGIHVAGDRAQEFLQGQLSCDLREVTHQQIRQGALCNLKGRILALLDIVDWDNHGFNLIVPDDLLDKTLASLAKTALFSKVSLSTATDYQVFGFYLQNPLDEIPFGIELPTSPYSVTYKDNVCCYSLEKNSYVFLMSNNDSHSICEPFIKKTQWRGSLAWHALQLQHKRIEIYTESRGTFLPHRLGLQLTGYLNFNKGCYVGQEIIARTHYRATLKHELKLFIIQTTEPMASGANLLNEQDDQTFGELIDFCPLGHDQFLIAASVTFEHSLNARIENHKTVVVLQPFTLDFSHFYKTDK